MHFEDIPWHIIPARQEGEETDKRNEGMHEQIVNHTHMQTRVIQTCGAVCGAEVLRPGR